MNRLALMALVCLLAFAIPGYADEHPAASVIKCDVFEVTRKLEGRTLTVSLKTDLPDDTIVMASVSRNYMGGNVEYPIEYPISRSRSTVADWRRAMTLDVSDADWLGKFEERRDLLTKLGEWHTPTKISDSISVSLTVPINQPNEAFGLRNANLRGAMVEKSGKGKWVMRVVSREFLHPLPLAKPPYPHYQQTLKKDEPLPEYTAKGAKILGKWKADDPILSETITIYRVGKKHYVHSKYKDGSEGVRELQRRAGKSKAGTYFDFTNDNDGQYYLVKAKTGLLVMGDKHGVVFRGTIVK